MRRVPFFVGRVLMVTVAGLLLLAGPARADVFTIHFQGEADLTSEGGGVYAYSGFFSWDSSALPHEENSNDASYALLDFALTFDGNDFTFPPSPDGNGNGLFVVNDADAFGSGTDGDAFAFYMFVGRPYDPTGDLFLVGVFEGLTSMFDSTKLPQNTDFLQQSRWFSGFFFESDEPGDGGEVVIETRGTLEVVGVEQVPEPATMALTAFGLLGALARARRRSS